MDWSKLIEIFNTCELKDNKILIKNNLLQILEFIKKHYKFEILKSITAIHNEDNSFELIYRLYSLENEEDIIISINIQNEIESISSLFDSAIADEKEIYDLFGIKFLNNPELNRLYMPESWQGHPLRKDYEENDERLNWNDKT